MTQRFNQMAWLALGLSMFGCAPESPASVSSPAITNGASTAPTTPPPSAAQAGHSAAPTTTQPAAASTLPPAASAKPAAASAAPAMTPAAPAAPPMAAAAMPPAAAPGMAPATPPENHEAHAGAAAGAAAPAAPPAGAAPGFPGVGAGEGAESFCAKYEMHCHYGQPMRHADKAACMADYNGNPAQQGCKSMHLDTAIAGTAAACNGMPSDFCFSIHCLHAAGLPDPTGTTYCK